MKNECRRSYHFQGGMNRFLTDILALERLCLLCQDIALLVPYSWYYLQSNDERQPTIPTIVISFVPDRIERNDYKGRHLVGGESDYRSPARYRHKR